jgi:hypothetical protein
MTTRRLVLHLGLPKTGTTALQMWSPAALATNLGHDGLPRTLRHRKRCIPAQLLHIGNSCAIRVGFSR